MNCVEKKISIHLLELGGSGSSIQCLFTLSRVRNRILHQNDNVRLLCYIMIMESNPGVKPEIMVTVTFACPGPLGNPGLSHDMEGLYTIGGSNNSKPPASIQCDTHQVAAPYVAMHNLEPEIANLEELERLQKETRKADGFSDN